MNSSTELRKLPPTNIRELVDILESDECWKKLMCLIPKILEKDNYECKITLKNLHKYNSEHFRILENAAMRKRRSCTEILFDEWGTSGRVRPALGHLLYLLTKAELFRAADYVAGNLLGIDLPARPPEGPAALVNVSLPTEPQKPDPYLQEVERILDAIDYPSSVIANLQSNDCAADVNNHSPPVIPEIVVIEAPESNIDNESAFNVPLVIDNRENSDLIQFSKSDITDTSTEPSDDSDTYLPNLSEIDSEAIPAIGQLLTDSSTESQIIPNLSLLNSNSCSDSGSLPTVNSGDSGALPDLSALGMKDSNFDVPQLSALLISDNSNSYSSLEFSQNSSQQSHLSASNSRPTCASPLPNLSLNTLLPHFSYNEIEIATNNFDETLHKNCLQIEDSLAKSNGRFLGSGAFGSVFLAIGLTERPVAVKKLVLDNVDIVNVDDTVTKQFRNEVEVLSRYKHENLLSLIGYSCDGPTYCLLYEFIPGGALNHRLQNDDDTLLWTDRLNIALGTAKAVSYLHTGYNTPLIHRDIKTANILLDCSKKPKLCDFGLIKLSPNQNTYTSTTVFGTSAYMAREAFRGDVSVKLDTFSFGVVLLELITGLPPLDENREGKDLVTHIEEVCEDHDISLLIDIRAGSWRSNDINFAVKLFEIASSCIEENKKKRPYMVDVTKQLENLIKKSHT